MRPLPAIPPDIARLRMSPRERLALAMWREGWDSFEIAQALGQHQSIVARVLPILRAHYRDHADDDPLPHRVEETGERAALQRALEGPIPAPRLPFEEGGRGEGAQGGDEEG